MKKIISILTSIFSVSLLSFSAYAIEDKDLWGEWQYSGFIYEDKIYPLPNPNLYLSFTFREDNLVRLYWKRTDESFFCERLAQFSVSNTSMLSQTIVWVNPNNHSSCSVDPDMQLGRVTENYVDFSDNNLRLFLELNGKPFIYILKNVSSSRALK